MTNEQAQVCDDLWREALEAGLVRWMPGMVLRADGWEPLRIVAEIMPFVWTGICGENVGHDYAHNVGDDALPVWTDPATLGCLLAMAREATGDAKLHCHWCGVGLHWRAVWFLTASDCRAAEGEVEPEALLRSILATRGTR